MQRQRYTKKETIMVNPIGSYTRYSCKFAVNVFPKHEGNVRIIVHDPLSIRDCVLCASAFVILEKGDKSFEQHLWLDDSKYDENCVINEIIIISIV